MKNKLIDLITVGITRCCVKRTNGETIDEAAIIADVLIENGVIVPPCKVGDKVFFINHINDVIPDFISEDTVTKIGITTRGVAHERGVDSSEFNKTAFFCRQAAEKMLNKE